MRAPLFVCSKNEEMDDKRGRGILREYWNSEYCMDIEIVSCDMHVASFDIISSLHIQIF